MSQHKGAKGGLGRTPPKPNPRIRSKDIPWAVRTKAGSPIGRSML